MIENPFPLKFAPGLFRNGTKYQAKGRWYNSNLVRWFEDAIFPVGGWDIVGDTQSPPVGVTVTGFPRGGWAWRGNDSASWLSVGTVGTTTTTTLLYAFADGILTDITPAGGVTTGSVDGGIAGAVDIGSGYGNGAYGNGIFSSNIGGRTIGEADTWSLDNFGENLVALFTADGRPLSWDKDRTHDAVPITGAPRARALVVTPEHFLMLLGADGDVRKAQWPDQNTTTDWTPTDTNQAGDEVLATEGRLMAGARIRRQTLIWSDVDVLAATYVGGDTIYRFEVLGANAGLLAPWAWAKAAGAVFWMSDKKFFKYDGAVQEIRSDVSDDIFNDLNITQRAKIYALPLPQYNEVWWFFPSVSSTSLENSRYVVHNYNEGTFFVGTLARATAIPRGVFATPILLKPTGEMLQHEVGWDHEGMKPFAESGPVEIADGQQAMFVDMLIPDEKNQGEVRVKLLYSDYPNEVEGDTGFVSAANPTDVRLEARQVRIYLEEVANTGWRIGTFRLGVQPAGQR